MSLKASEIAEVLKSQLSNLDGKLDVSETGSVLAVGDGVAKIYGLEKAMAGELVDFGNGVSGMILNLEEMSVGAAILGDETLIKEGGSVKRTGKIVQVPVGKELLGRVVNALGQPVDGLGEIKASKYGRVEVKAPGIIERKSVHEPLQTGIKAIDAMIPIGRGQRELIIGDRQTGKTAIAIDTIINQKGKNVFCIYVAIGQKQSTVAQVVDRLKKSGAMDYTIVVAANASEQAPFNFWRPIQA